MLAGRGALEIFAPLVTDDVRPDADLGEIMSIQHSRNVWYRLQPKAGDQLWTQLRRPILTVVADSSPGVQ